MPSAETVGGVITNGLETFEILEELSHNRRCTLFRVVCKSGRLRNRRLALKKVPILPVESSSAKPDFSPWISLHQALHHPNIVSLFSAFSTAQETFHILELCSAGNLASFIQSRSQKAIHESELRGVTKSLIDALSYLRKELVIHRDINPSNILLTGDYRIKLSGFEHSTRLTSKNITTSSYSGPSHGYVAPEIISGRPHGFPVDIWSLGYVVIYCLTGSAPFEAKDVPIHPVEVGHHLPEHYSGDVKAFVSRLWQIVPENRIYLPDMLSHPFLANDKPVTSLRPTSPLTSSKSNSYNSSNLFRDYHSCEFPNFQTNQASRKTMRHASDQNLRPIRGPTKVNSVEATELDLRSLLSNEFTSSRARFPPKSSHSTRRVASDPVRLRGANDREKMLDNEMPDVKSATALTNRTIPVLRSQAELDLCSAISSTASLQTQGKSSEATHVIHAHTPTLRESRKQRQPEFDEQTIISPAFKLPIGTARPAAFNTLGLSCQTHKTVHGHVTVLPSHSLLVDFRESQRRKGLKGNEVLVIGPDGKKIAIYGAPHLSAPCCLIEPIQEFSIRTLPQTYWKQYNDASRLVGEIQRRTPKLVLYSAGAKSTLMANTPHGEIEVLLKDPAASSRCSPCTRIRFSRQDKSVEFAQHNQGIQGEEWTTKVIPLVAESSYISTKCWKDLKQEERDAMRHLIHFVQVCDTYEELMNKLPPDSASVSPPMDEDTKVDFPIATGAESVPRTRRISASVPISSFSLFNIAPRPPKIPAASAIHGTAASSVNETEYAPLEQDTSTKRGLSNINSIQRDDLNQIAMERGIQSRFIPSAGWCVRYPSKVSQGGRYKMMFLDGAALEVDVDEDWAEFKGTSGEITSYAIQDCGAKREIGDRMKVFEEFVSLFDESREE